MPASRRCWAEVDLNALRENLAWIRHRVGPKVKIMTVVKADAYGHGLKQIAALLMQSGTDIFGVANLVEAQAIRSVGKGWPILMLGACLPDEVELAVREGVNVTISTMGEAERLAATAKKLGKPGLAHLKVDTGMGRLGVKVEEAAALLERVERLPGINVQGIYTHFAAVEDDAEFSVRQKKLFQKAVGAMVGKRSLEYIHAHNSGGLLFEADSIYNTVRPGLLVYGVMPPGKRRAKEEFAHHFRPALSWKCRVSMVKEIAAGDVVELRANFYGPETDGGGDIDGGVWGRVFEGRQQQSAGDHRREAMSGSWAHYHGPDDGRRDEGA